MATSALGKFFARQRPAVDWAVVPGTTREIDAVVRYCRRLVSKRARWQPASRWFPSRHRLGHRLRRCRCKLIPDINPPSA